jgi:hypothetical protein
MEGHLCTVKLLCPVDRGNSKEKKVRLRSGPGSGEVGEKNLMLAHPPWRERDKEFRAEKEMEGLEVNVSLSLSSLGAIPNFHVHLMEVLAAVAETGLYYELESSPERMMFGYSTTHSPFLPEQF